MGSYLILFLDPSPFGREGSGEGGRKRLDYRRKAENRVANCCHGTEKRARPGFRKTSETKG